MRVAAKNNKLCIFTSIDGEANFYHQGRVTTFVRLAGCNLFPSNLCRWCDTEWAQDVNGGIEMSVEEVFEKIREKGIKKVTITGGEPLVQSSELISLLDYLYTENYKVTIETNGTIRPHCEIITRSFLVYDWKLTSSGINHLMRLDTFDNVRAKDFVKFVIKDRKDFEEAIVVMDKLDFPPSSSAPTFVFSPILSHLSAKRLLRWMVKDRLDAILSVQLHKLLDLEEDGK